MPRHRRTVNPVKSTGRYFPARLRLMEEGRKRHSLRAGFDQAAEDFDRTRPVCPPQVFDDLVRLAGLASGDRVIEIGCGTGQATVSLAERGLTITAVGLGAELAAVARRRLARFPSVDVLTTSFEAWEPPGAPFDAVVAFNSLHWIDPQLRYSKPSELLRPGAAMVVGGCLWARPADAERFWVEVQADYRAVGYEGEPPPPPEQIGPRHLPAEAGAFFEEVASLRYPSRSSTAPRTTWPSWLPSPARARSARPAALPSTLVSATGLSHSAGLSSQPPSLVT
jgi:SAM-dependent methyltransferase